MKRHHAHWAAATERRSPRWVRCDVRSGVEMERDLASTRSSIRNINPAPLV